MRTVDECYGCLENLVHLTARLATDDPESRALAVREGMALLDREFPRSRIPTQIAGEAQRVIRKITGNPDPFRAVKEREMVTATRLIADVRGRLGHDLPDLMRLAVLGNTVDFFKDLDTVAEQVQRPVELYRDETGVFLERLQRARLVLYLADNASECYFDYPLLEKLADRSEVVYAVKDGPVQNDLTIPDLERSGLNLDSIRVVTTGTDSPGLDWALAPPAFHEIFDRADLVVAKGMGNYETLSESKARHKIFHLLMAKCRPVAAALKVPLDSFVGVFG